MAEKKTIVRNAGLFERFHVSRHYLGYDSCVVVTAQYLCKDRRVDESSLFPALHRVIEGHLALAVQIVGESNQPAYQRLRQVDLTKIVTFVDQSSEALQTILEEQWLVQLDTNSDLPLWRLTVLNDNTIIFAWHHCIGDGMSGLAFHRALHAAFNTDNTNYQGLDVVIIPVNLSLSPAVEKVVNVWPSLSQFFRVLYNTLAPISWTQSSSAWSGKPVVVSPLYTRFRLLKFTSEQNSQLIGLCRKNNATITPLLHNLAVSALSVLLLEPASTSNQNLQTISTFIPINLRPLSSISPDVMCDHVSTFHSYPSISSTFSWSGTAKFGAQLRAFRSKAAGKIGMLMFIFGQYQTFFRDKVGKKREGGIEISNAGRFEETQDAEKVLPGEWKVGSMVFAQSDVVTGAALKVGVVSTVLGGLSISVTWGPNAVDDTLANAFVSKFNEGILRLIREAA